MTDNNTPNTAQQENTTQPEGNGPAGKMFTQEEVNNIVRERLNRVKAGAAEQDERATALDEREAAVQQREQAMQQKESRAACEDHCKAKGYDTAFLDLLDTSDPERFTALLDKLHETAAADLKAQQEAEQATQAEQSAAQRLEHMELDNALAQQAAGLKFSSESAGSISLPSAKSGILHCRAVRSWGLTSTSSSILHLIPARSCPLAALPASLHRLPVPRFPLAFMTRSRTHSNRKDDLDYGNRRFDY